MDTSGYWWCKRSTYTCQFISFAIFQFLSFILISHANPFSMVILHHCIELFYTCVYIRILFAYVKAYNVGSSVEERTFVWCTWKCMHALSVCNVPTAYYNHCMWKNLKFCVPNHVHKSDWLKIQVQFYSSQIRMLWAIEHEEGGSVVVIELVTSNYPQFCILLRSFSSPFKGFFWPNPRDTTHSTLTPSLNKRHDTRTSSI